MKKAVSLLLLLSLLCFCLPSLALSGQEEGESRISFTFYSDVNPAYKHLTGSVPYSDAYFSGPATEYCHALARASMGLAFSNFREKGLGPEEQGYAVRDFLTAAGFRDLQADQYDVDTTSDTVASMIARKETVIGGEKCTLIALSVCGAGYNNEWLSNFTFSEEDRHAGFDRAADKVLSRLLLYLFNEPAEGKLKIWVSGYSRAGAIANLLGQKLSNQKLCPAEELYVYTFAAPNTATAESGWDCPSVFNIVGAFDPVPAIPPAEWGYTRYGTTLFLPAREVDSDYLSLRQPVEKIYRELTRLEYWDSPACNWILQKLFQILYSNIDSARVYNLFVKDIISEMWVTSGILPRVRLLSDVMNASKVTDSSVRSVVSSFSEALSPFLYNLLTKSGEGEDGGWGKGVSLLSQLMHEHFPDVYYAWMMSGDDPDRLFISSPCYYRVSLAPGLGITAIRDAETGLSLPMEEISGISFDVSGVRNIPADRSCILTLTAEKDITGGAAVINRYALPSQQADTRILSLEMREGESAELLFPAEGEIAVLTAPEASRGDAAALSPADAAGGMAAAVFEYSQSGWLARNLLGLALWIPVVLLAVLAFVLIRVNIRKKEKLFYVRRAFFGLMIVFFMIDQVLRNFFPWGVLPIILCQGICSVSGALISFFAWLQKKSRYTLLLLFSMLLWTAGDVITKASSLAGTVCYGIGHLLLCFAFCLDERPERRHAMILVAALVPVFAVELFTEPQLSDLIPSMIYSVLILAMAVLSSLRGAEVMAGGMLFVVSDLMLTLRTVLNAPGWLFFLTLGTYYLSVAFLSSSALAQPGAAVKAEEGSKKWRFL